MKIINKNKIRKNKKKKKKKKKNISEKELKNMYENGVMKIINKNKIRKNKNIIDPKWVLTIKDNSAFKARLMVKGC